MSSSLTLTIDEYEHMVACGAFVGPNAKRIELIRGELRMMSPQGSEHSEIVSVLDDWSHAETDRSEIKIRIQSSIAIPGMVSQPEPDIVWAKSQSYGRRRPHPDEVVLLIEVADSSVAYDLGEKCRLYAEAGISEYWVVSIPDRTLHVFRNPHAAAYRDCRVLQGSDRICPERYAQATLDLAGLFRSLDV